MFRNWGVIHMAPPAGLEPATPWLTVRCSTDWAKEEYETRETYSVSLVCVGYELSSRAVASQVFSPLQRLTSVFGMGTGGPTALKTLTHIVRPLGPTILKSFARLVHLRGLEPRTHWLRVSCSTNWARGASIHPSALSKHPYKMLIKNRTKKELRTSVYVYSTKYWLR